MATGWLVNGVCFESPAEAQNAFFSSQPVLSHFDTVAGFYINIYFELIGGVWMRSSTASGANWSNVYAPSVPAPIPVFPACYSPSESFADGLAIGWAFAACMTVVFFVMVGRRFFSHV